MNKDQFHSLWEKFVTGQTLRIRVKDGRDGTLLKIRYHSLEVQMPDGVVKVGYKNCDLIDQDGNVIGNGILDVMGREIEAGDFVASVPSSSREVRVYQVSHITRVGMISIQSTKTKKKTCVYPSRVLKLPVTENDLVLWTLREFQKED